MIQVDISRDEDQRIREIRWVGSDDEETDSDLLAAEVSVTTLLHTAKVGLERYLKLDPEIENELDEWVLRLKRDQLLNREIDAVLETMLLGLYEIERKYGDYVTVKDTTAQVSV
ncbi:MAG: ribosomal-processing cysteine protease Prp [Candidatus Bipolaricaulia bacterium]